MRPLRVAFAGTGTEVGKTTVAIRAAEGLRAAGRSVRALKPIETGFVDASHSDAAHLARGAGHDPVVPYFAAMEPVAPLRAAAHAGRNIDVAEIGAWVAHNELPGTEVTLIETAGGLFTPLGPTLTNLDLLLALSVDAWVLVARDRLGVLHDCLATLAAARARGCSPVAVILAARDPSPPVGNATDLATCTGLPVYQQPDRTLLSELLVRSETLTLTSTGHDAPAL